MQKPKSKHAVEAASDICRMSAVELAAAMRAKTLSSREVVTAFLDRIEAVNPKVNAVVSLRPRDEILRDADAADEAIASGSTGALLGLPMAIKDLALTKGLRTTFGSPIFKDHVPEEDEFFVERVKATGAIVIGKTNVPEFGLGSHTYNNVFGATSNAFDPAISAGGSSGGAAVSLALDMLPVADGSDFGGSLRNPACWNNVFGFRPSQGLVPSGPSKDDFIAQMGVEGPMGRTVADVALLLSAQAGHDPRAPLSWGHRGGFTDLGTPRRGFRIGWMGNLGGHLPIEDGILSLCEDALRRFEGEGAAIEPAVPAFDFEKLWNAFVTIRHATSGMGLKEHYDDPAKRALLKPEAIFEVEGGLRLTAPQIRDATVTRSGWYKTMLALFERFDFLALPVAAVFPFDINEHWPKEIAGRKMTSYHRWLEVCSYATLAACPAISLPAGFDARGRAMGLQLIGRPRGDREVLEAAGVYEQAMPWTYGIG
ncbi:MAG TPA: amidase [Rhizobiaceae bacterium]|nr:amidase [Rhizobiaceae bacterium]